MTNKKARRGHSSQITGGHKVKSSNKVKSIMANSNINTGVNSLSATTDTASNVLAALKSELQEYHNNTSKGDANRRRNMVLLAWDIRKLERKQNASTMRDKVKALMLSAGYVLANGSTLKDYTNDADLLQYLDSVAWVCLQNDTLSICNA